jgi:hypothetical protein
VLKPIARIIQTFTRLIITIRTGKQLGFRITGINMKVIGVYAMETNMVMPGTGRILSLGTRIKASGIF